MIEGLQELEARIFVEQALDRGILPADQAQRVAEQLARHFKGTFAGGQDWQPRSKKMYQLAYEVGQAVGLDVAESELSLTAKAGAQTTVRIKLRNWTNKPRQWKAQGSEKWIVPAKAQGMAQGIEDLEVQIHGEVPGLANQSAGVLTITDVETGRAYPVKITVRAGNRQNPAK
jgi:hypothetical protein